MKKSLYIITFCALSSVGLHLYLSHRSYSLLTDKAKSSFCYINEVLNCDSALTSAYSEWAGLPLAVWGLVVAVILTLLALCLLLKWTETPSFFWLIMGFFATLSAGASIVMLGISYFLLKLFCPLCMVLYALSFILFALTLLPIKKHFSALSKKGFYRVLAYFLMAWPAGALIAHLIFMNLYNVKSMEKTIQLSMKDWHSTPIKNTKIKPLLTFGSTKQASRFTIMEFADFLCSHCRNSYYTLKKFKASHPQVRVEYFAFPLDQCQSERVSCTLIKAVYCAKKQQKGWYLHDLIFENQKDFIPLTDAEKALEKIKQKIKTHTTKQTTENTTKQATENNWDWEKWEKCIQSPATKQFVESQIQAGKKLKVTGTPTLFVNGKKISSRYLMKTLKTLFKHLNI